MSFHLIDLT